MKYLEEFSDPVLARKLVDQIHATVTKPWAMMEVCGGQTHTIVRHGIDQLLPDGVEMIHGPGCPVCVTPLEIIDKALEIAAQPGVIFCSFGDMLRVPGSGRDLFRIKSEGGDVRVVYSPLDALRMAQQNPDKRGRVLRHRVRDDRPAERDDRLPGQEAGHPELQPARLARPGAARDRGDHAVADTAASRRFLAAGHVCSVMGTSEYPELAEKYEVPIVVTGFEPLDILAGILRTVSQLEKGEHVVENAYRRAVQDEGNPAAKAMLADVFEIDRPGLAGDRDDPAERLAAVRAVPRVRRGVPVPGPRHRRPRSRRCAAAVRCCRA